MMFMNIAVLALLAFTWIAIGCWLHMMAKVFQPALVVVLAVVMTVFLFGISGAILETVMMR